MCIHPVRRKYSLCAYEVNPELERERTPRQMAIAKNVKLLFATIVFAIFILKVI